jgi:hypothetical protein
MHQVAHTVKYCYIVFGMVMTGWLCCGCFVRLDHDEITREPLEGAKVVISRMSGWEFPIASNALAYTRPPIITTGKNGAFSIRPVRNWDVVDFRCERYHRHGGTLVIERAGYETMAVTIWGDICPISVVPTNFFAVLLKPVGK